MKHIYPSSHYLVHFVLLLSLPIICNFSCISPKAEVESRQAIDKQDAAVLASVHTKSITNLQKEVMAVHDSLMPAMTKLMHLKRELKIRLQDEKIVDEDKQRAMRDAVISLENADEAMMTWMRSYKTTYKGMEEVEIKDYLAKEKQHIDQVRQKMTESMMKAKNILTSH